MKKGLYENSSVFQDEETFNRIHEQCLENRPQATEEIRDAYEAMHNNFDQYLDAMEEWVFRYAYQCGYETAMQHIRKGGN